MVDAEIDGLQRALEGAGDFRLDGRCGRGRERQKRRSVRRILRQVAQHLRQEEVIRTEVVAPEGEAVGLIHHEERDARAAQRVDEAAAGAAAPAPGRAAGTGPRRSATRRWTLPGSR